MERESSFSNKDKLTPQEEELIKGLFRGENLEEIDRLFVHAQGRSMFLKRPIETDSVLTHIQLSGGLYVPFRSNHGLAFQGKTPPLPPSSDNFAIGREDMFTSEFVIDKDTLGETAKAYVPTGAYTQTQAEIKAANTVGMAKAMKQDHPQPFVIPRLQFLYSLPQYRDPDGNPLFGIAFLVPPPTARFDYFFNQYLKGLNPEQEPIKKFEELVAVMCITLFKISTAARIMHDRYGVYHRQLHLGNAGLVSKDLIYIADWDTVKNLPPEHEAELLARALDLTRLWYASTRLIDFLVEIPAFRKLQQEKYLGSLACVGALNSIVDGYNLHSPSKHGPASARTVIKLTSGIPPVEQCKIVKSLLAVAHSPQL